jgi:hypothetical protein
VRKEKLTSMLKDELERQKSNNMKDFAEYLATPVIVTPNMDDEEWEYEFKQMFYRSVATTQFLDGELTFDQFEQMLDFYGRDPIEHCTNWSNGYTLLP